MSFVVAYNYVLIEKYEDIGEYSFNDQMGIAFKFTKLTILKLLQRMVAESHMFDLYRKFKYFKYLTYLGLLFFNNTNCIFNSGYFDILESLIELEFAEKIGINDRFELVKVFQD